VAEGAARRVRRGAAGRPRQAEVMLRNGKGGVSSLLALVCAQRLGLGAARWPLNLKRRGTTGLANAEYSITVLFFQKRRSALRGPLHTVGHALLALAPGLALIGVCASEVAPPLRASPPPLPPTARVARMLDGRELPRLAAPGHSSRRRTQPGASNTFVLLRIRHVCAFRLCVQRS
jgi:hypothetical protein